jgi:hypothetical protein
MQLLQAPKRSPRRVSSSHDDPNSWNSELFAQHGPDQLASRHDSQMLPVRTIPADPYTAWLDQREADQREADRRSSTVAASSRPAGRFSRSFDACLELDSDL